MIREIKPLKGKDMKGEQSMKLSNGAKVGLILEVISFIWIIICILKSVVVPDCAMYVFVIGAIIIFASKFIEVRKRRQESQVK